MPENLISGKLKSLWRSRNSRKLSVTRLIRTTNDNKFKTYTFVSWFFLETRGKERTKAFITSVLAVYMYIDRFRTHVSSFGTISWLRQVREPVSHLHLPPFRRISTRVSNWLFFVECIVPAGAIRVFRPMYCTALTSTTHLQIVLQGVRGCWLHFTLFLSSFSPSSSFYLFSFSR